MGNQVKVLSKEDSSRVIGKMLEEVYTEELTLFIFNSNEDESGNIYFSIL